MFPQPLSLGLDPGFVFTVGGILLGQDGSWRWIPKHYEQIPAALCGGELLLLLLSFMVDSFEAEVSERDCREALLNEQFICSQQSFFFRPRRQVLIVRRDISTCPSPSPLSLTVFFSLLPPTLPPAIRNWIWSRTIHLVSLLHLYPSLPASTPPL